MTTIEKLRELTIIQKTMRRFEQKRPNMELKDAIDALEAIVLEVATKERGHLTMEAAAIEVLASERVQAHIPPW